MVKHSKICKNRESFPPRMFCRIRYACQRKFILSLYIVNSFFHYVKLINLQNALLFTHFQLSLYIAH